LNFDSEWKVNRIDFNEAVYLKEQVKNYAKTTTPHAKLVPKAFLIKNRTCERVI